MTGQDSDDIVDAYSSIKEAVKFLQCGNLKTNTDDAALKCELY